MVHNGEESDSGVDAFSFSKKSTVASACLFDLLAMECAIPEPPYKGNVTKRSAGLLMYRRRGDGLEVFLVHPGGPFWKKKDAGSWTIPKGEFTDGEDPLDAARHDL